MMINDCGIGAGFSRRRFLGGSGVLASTLVTQSLASGVPDPQTEPAAVGVSDASQRVLVLLHLAGGNDPWNIVPPLAASYTAARPTLTHAAGMLPRRALHPALGGFSRLMAVGRAGVFLGVGTPGGERSHPHCCLAWDEAALPRSRPSDGWALRAAEASPGPLVLWTDSPDVPRVMARVDPRVGVPVECRTAASGERLAGRLTRLADRIASCDGRLIAHLVLDGFDTHARQAAAHAALLGELSDGLVKFDRALHRHRAAGRVLTIAYSETGRTLAENAEGGTDHGDASVVLMTGAGVRAGVGGSCDELIDFRRVHAAALAWLGVDAPSVLGRAVEPAPLLA